MSRLRAPGDGSQAGKALPLLAVLIVALVLAACRGGAASPAASSSAPSTGSAVPSGSGEPAPAPEPTSWPGTTVLAVIALGAADGEIRKAGDDLQKAADTEDLALMWGAADGLARLVEALMFNLDRLEIYDRTKPIAVRYREALPVLLDGAKQLRDSITSGDSSGVIAGSQRIAQGLRLYGEIREPLAVLVDEAIEQQRLLLK